MSEDASLSAYRLFSLLSVYELKLVLNDVVAIMASKAGAFHAQVTLEGLSNKLQQIDDGGKVYGAAQDIVNAVAIKHGLTADDLRSPARYRMYVIARQEAAWTLRQRTDLSLPQIARVLNRKDHTTVLHACRAHQKRLREQRRIEDELSELHEAAEPQRKDAVAHPRIGT